MTFNINKFNLVSTDSTEKSNSLTIEGNPWFFHNTFR